MRCPACGGPLRVVSTLVAGDATCDYRHLKLDGYIDALERYGNNWISRRRKCVVKTCGWTGTSIEVLTEGTNT